MKKVILLLSFLLGVCGYTNFLKAEVCYLQAINDSIVVKTVKDYVESNEFIDIIPERHYQNLKSTACSANEKKDADYRMKAAIYRFYKRCIMDKDGFITCGISSGKEINITEELFEMLLRDIGVGNKWIEGWKQKGTKYKTTRLDDKYFNNLLNYK